MSDARLRELERRWKETNSPDDEAAYLLERVRVGDLTRERLELAAYCGHEAACKLTTVSPLADFDEFIGGLRGFGDRNLMCAALGVAYMCVPFTSNQSAPARELLDRKVQWLTDPAQVVRFGDLKLQNPADFAIYLTCQAPLVLDPSAPRDPPREDHFNALVGVVRTAASILGVEAVRHAATQRLIQTALADSRTQG